MHIYMYIYNKMKILHAIYGTHEWGYCIIGGIVICIIDDLIKACEVNYLEDYTEHVISGDCIPG